MPPPKLTLTKVELPNKMITKYVDNNRGRVTAADVAAKAGLDLLETRRQLLLLAKLIGAEMQVSDSGELVFVFGDGVRTRLRASSWRASVSQTWDRVSPSVFWLARASFGVALLTSLTVALTALTALSSSREESSSTNRQGASIPMHWLGPNPLDIFWYSTYPRYRPPGEMGLLQSCFSLLFGDGDPNVAIDERATRAAAALIRAQGGAVTAEQLAPLLNPKFDPEATVERDKDSLVEEGWVTDTLVRLGGDPRVTADGDIVYVFEELMTSAEEMSTAASTVLEALAFDEAPSGWLPAQGETVLLKQLSLARTRMAQRSKAYERDLERLSTIIGAQGVVLSSGSRIVVEFGNKLVADFDRDELAPVASSQLDGVAVLTELPIAFSLAPSDQLLSAGFLAALNLFVVGYLGVALRTARFSAPILARSIGGVYPLLLTYALGFVAVPLVRAARVEQKNRGIRARNAARRAWAAALNSKTFESIQRKLSAARRLRPGAKIIRESSVDYSSSQPVGQLDNPLSDFDRRLNNRSDGRSGGVAPQ